jgi:hypothetical protein
LRSCDAFNTFLDMKVKQSGIIKSYKLLPTSVVTFSFPWIHYWIYVLNFIEVTWVTCGICCHISDVFVEKTSLAKYVLSRKCSCNTRLYYKKVMHARHQ